MPDRGLEEQGPGRPEQLARASDGVARENYLAEVLQNHETRMRVSDAIRYLREAIERTTQLQKEKLAV